MTKQDHSFIANAWPKLFLTNWRPTLKKGLARNLRGSIHSKSCMNEWHEPVFVVFDFWPRTDKHFRLGWSRKTEKPLANQTVHTNGCYENNINQLQHKSKNSDWPRHIIDYHESHNRSLWVSPQSAGVIGNGKSELKKTAFEKKELQQMPRRLRRTQRRPWPDETCT